MNRQNIQIHRGNFASDVEGCILLGLTKGPSAVYESVKAMELLQQELYRGNLNPEIRVEIRDVGAVNAYN